MKGNKMKKTLNQEVKKKYKDYLKRQKIYIKRSINF
jgi:hypothetical protein